MCVSRQIREDLGRTAEGSLCINNPIESASLLEERSPIETGRTLAKRCTLAKSLSEQTEKTTTKVTGQDLDRQQEVLSRHDGEATIRNRKAAARDHAVQMGMKRERLTPGMKHREKTENDTEMARIAANHEQRLTDGSEQDLVKESSIGEGERIEQIGNGEDDMEVRNGK